MELSTSSCNFHSYVLHMHQIKEIRNKKEGRKGKGNDQQGKLAQKKVSETRKATFQGLPSIANPLTISQSFMTLFMDTKP
jgi:hypothetical protein